MGLPLVASRQISALALVQYPVNALLIARYGCVALEIQQKERQ